MRYTIDLDRPEFGLETKPGYLTIEMDGRCGEKFQTFKKDADNDMIRIDVF